MKKADFVIDQFLTASGRTFVGIIQDGKLLVRAHVKGRNVAVNLTPDNAERMGIMLCRYLEHIREVEHLEVEIN